MVLLQHRHVPLARSMVTSLELISLRPLDVRLLASCSFDAHVLRHRTPSNNIRKPSQQNQDIRKTENGTRNAHNKHQQTPTNTNQEQQVVPHSTVVPPPIAHGFHQYINLRNESIIRRSGDITAVGTEQRTPSCPSSSKLNCCRSRRRHCCCRCCYGLAPTLTTSSKNRNGQAPQTLTALSKDPETSLSLKTLRDHTPEHSRVLQHSQSGPHTRMVWSLLADT